MTGFHDWNAISLPFRQFGDSDNSAINQVGPELTRQQLNDALNEMHRNDLTITLADAPDPVAAGTPLNHTVAATNLGPNPAGSVRETTTLPTALSLTATSTGCSVSGQTVICDRGELMRGDTTSTSIATMVPADLVYKNGGPLTLSTRSEITDLTGSDAKPGDNIAVQDTTVVAVADLSVTSLTVPNPPIAMPLRQWVVVRLTSTITSGGPSSPMDTAIELFGTASFGGTINPTMLTTSQPHLVTNEIRVVESYVSIFCDRGGSNSFGIDQRIRPLNTADTDPNPANDLLHVDLDVVCR